MISALNLIIVAGFLAILYGYITQQTNTIRLVAGNAKMQEIARCNSR